MPCLFLSGVAGILTGAIIFLFKLVANLIIHLSIDIYSAARMSPQYIIPVLLGAAVLKIYPYRHKGRFKLDFVLQKNTNNEKAEV